VCANCTAPCPLSSSGVRLHDRHSRVRMGRCRVQQSLRNGPISSSGASITNNSLFLKALRGWMPRNRLDPQASPRQSCLGHEVTVQAGRLTRYGQARVSHQWLARVCFIDLRPPNGAGGRDGGWGDRAEFALIVADAWQEHGFGAASLGSLDSDRAAGETGAAARSSRWTRTKPLPGWRRPPARHRSPVAPSALARCPV
jgi:hypothetical protein